MIEVRKVDYSNAAQCEALLMVLDAYARDPMGGATPLPEDTRQRLCQDLARFPGAVSFLAWEGEQAVGLVNAFMGYSTFKARPLMNVHDIAVLQPWRGKGIGKMLLQALEDYAVQKGCCKLTLEVLTGNEVARNAYVRFGFEDYSLDPRAGTAVFMQKWL